MSTTYETVVDFTAKVLHAVDAQWETGVIEDGYTIRAMVNAQAAYYVKHCPKDEVLAVYGELVDPEDSDTVWNLHDAIVDVLIQTGERATMRDVLKVTLYLRTLIALEAVGHGPEDYDARMEGDPPCR